MRSVFVGPPCIVVHVRENIILWYMCVKTLFYYCWLQTYLCTCMSCFYCTSLHIAHCLSILRDDLNPLQRWNLCFIAMCQCLKYYAIIVQRHYIPV